MQENLIETMDKKELRIVFLGTPEFAVESLRRIYEGGYNIVGVVTMPDKPAGRGHKMLQSPVKQYALEHDLHLMQPINLKDPEFVEHLRSLEANLFIVIAFRMLPEIVWRMPKLGTFNLHASLLPLYRGAAPINWAVINGEKETGVTTFFLKHEIDTGDIIAQEKIQIGDNEDVGSVHDRLMNLGAGLTIDTIEHILAEDLKPIPQERLLTFGETPTPAPKIFKETCRIDWNKSVKDVYNLIRGLSPYPGAWTRFSDNGEVLGDMKIYEAEIFENSDFIPGRVRVDNGKILIDCIDGSISLLSVQMPGKRRMAVADYLRGSHLTSPSVE